MRCMTGYISFMSCISTIKADHSRVTIQDLRGKMYQRFLKNVFFIIILNLLILIHRSK